LFENIAAAAGPLDKEELTDTRLRIIHYEAVDRSPGGTNDHQHLLGSSRPHDVGLEISGAAQRALYYPYLGNFRNVKNGLSPGQMDRCYKGLGLRSLANPQGKNVLWALQWTPVIIMDVDKAFGHAMVVAGSRGQDYVIADPCAVEDLDFDKPGNDRCTFGMRKASRASADATLGSYIWYW